MNNSACVLSIALTVAAGAASADVTFFFENITNNSSFSAAAGEAQLSVTVSDQGSNRVGFRFNNVGSNAMSITDVYFDDGSLLGIASIINGPGVRFSQGASPRDLPGGSSINPPFETSAGFSADSDSPAPANGVNPGEQLTIIFNLINGRSYNDIITELSQSDELRVGIHVQAFQNGQSESFVTPAPGAIALAGLAGLAATRRRR